MRWVIIVSGVLMSMGTSSRGRCDPPAWTLVESESRLVARVEPKRSSLFSGLSHEHAISASRFTGSLRFDPKDPTTCALTLEVPVSGLVVDAPDVRKRLAMKDGPDESDRRTITGHMLADDQLDGAKHPLIRFSSSGCRASGKDVLVKGELTIRGKKRSLEVPMKISGDDTRVVARGSFGLVHADFGFEPYSAALGTIANAESIKFDVELVAKAK